MNEVGDFMLRHFTDCLTLELFTQPQLPGESPTCIFSTKVELNNLDLNHEKLTILVVGTSSMRSKGPPIHYTFEIDLLFKSRLVTDAEESQLEGILARYRMMKGSDKISRAEEEIIKMLMERVAIGKKLLPYKIKFRKCFFLLRNMMKTCY